MSEMEAVTTEENIDVAPGGGVSFDEMEASVQTKPEPAPKKSEPKAEVRVEKVGKDTQKEINDIQKEGTQAEQIKNILALIGDKETQLPSTAKFKVKVDGKEVETTLEELMGNYSGKTAWDKKFTELDKDRQELGKKDKTVSAREKELEEINKEVNHLHTLAKEGKAKEAIYHLAELLGANPIQMYRELLEGAGMESDEDRETQFLKEESEWKQTQIERERGLRIKAEEDRRVQADMDTVRSKLGLSMQEFIEVYDDLRESGYQDTITAESVGQHYETLVRTAKIENLVTEIAPGIEDTEKSDAIAELKNVVKTYPDVTDQELFEIATEVYGNNAAKKLSKKIYKATPQSNTTIDPERAEDPVSFEELA